MGGQVAMAYKYMYLLFFIFIIIVFIILFLLSLCVSYLYFSTLTKYTGFIIKIYRHIHEDYAPYNFPVQCEFSQQI